MCVCVCVWCLNTCMFFNGLHVLVLVHVHVHIHVALCVLGPSFPPLQCHGHVMVLSFKVLQTCSLHVAPYVI